MKSIGIVTDPLYLQHSNGAGHPESPSRLTAINEMLEHFAQKGALTSIAARDARRQELALVHDEPYIDLVESTRNQGFTMLDPDTGATNKSYDAAVRAAGGAIEAVQTVMDGENDGAFAFLRPPGHHAEAGRAMGFCLFNNVAIAAEFAMREFSTKRILIVDWDVHHGNGTMHSFYSTNEVLYFSVHQYPHYPGTGQVGDTGRSIGVGYTVNVPLFAGQADEEYAAVFDRILLPIAREYAPQLILVSAGFDAHEQDPLAHMFVSSEGFGRMASQLKGIAREFCQGKMALFLEGGYSLEALRQSTDAVLQSLLGEDFDGGSPPQPNDYTQSMLNRVAAMQKKNWKNLE